MHIQVHSTHSVPTMHLHLHRHPYSYKNASVETVSMYLKSARYTPLKTATQPVEHLPCVQEVADSNPGGIICFSTPLPSTHFAEQTEACMNLR